MNDRIRHYTDDRIEVTYDASRCIHAEVCIDGLPEVFDTARRPWILTSGAGADAIAEVIGKCPSGALHFKRLDRGQEEAPATPTTIVPMPGGPLQARGRIEVRSPDGGLIVEDSRMTLCRCGLSQNKPFCDNGHFASNFDDPPDRTADSANTATTEGELSPSPNSVITAG